MARPLRIEFAGALYHITARGNAREDIFSDEDDRISFLDLLRNTCRRYNWYCRAYCLMDNHYHLLIETGAPSLSKGMKYLNGTYTQAYNRKKGRVGHVFQGRFWAILVDGDRYLLELARYIVLNPVRACMVRSAKDWKWSSYRATAGLIEKDPCSTTDWILSIFSEKNIIFAQKSYREFVRQGYKHPSPWDSLKNQIYLGSDKFVENMQSKITPNQSLKDIPKIQKRAAPKPLMFYKNKYSCAREGMAIAYLSGHYTQVEVGDCFGVSYATVSRALKAYEKKL